MAKRKGTLKDIFRSPAKAAQTRIDTCEQYGMPVDPRDLEIVAEDKQYPEGV